MNYVIVKKIFLNLHRYLPISYNLCYTFFKNALLTLHLLTMKYLLATSYYLWIVGTILFIARHQLNKFFKHVLLLS